eukprot:7060341-Prymnesium_polylepis.1
MPPSNATNATRALFYDLTGCATLVCLRGLGLHTLLAAQDAGLKHLKPVWGNLFGPVGDDVFVHTPLKAPKAPPPIP